MITPSFALNFTTASLDSRVAFTRSTSASNPATYVANDGLVTAASNDQPRFDYDPVTLVCKGLLIEESRQNRVIQSEDLATTWTLSGVTIDSDQEISPISGQNADLIKENSANTAHALVQTISVVSGTVYTYSAFVKKGGRDYVVLTNTAGAGSMTACQVAFNLVTGALHSSTGATSTFIQDFNNGWYRVGYTAPAALSNGNPSWRIYLSNDGTINVYQGNGTDGVFAIGIQLEVGTFATSYIPTTTTALTRNADVATITGTNFSDFWQASKGGASVLATPSTVSGIRPLVQFDDNTDDNLIALRGNTTNPELYIKVTTDQVQLDAGTIAANTAYDLFGVWNTDDCAAKVNNGTKVFDTSATIPTVTQMRLGSDGTNYLNGTLATVSYYSGDQFSMVGRYTYTRRKNKVIPLPIF